MHGRTITEVDSCLAQMNQLSNGCVKLFGSVPSLLTCGHLRATDVVHKNMFFTFNDHSLNRHDVTHQEALEALEDPFKFEAETGEHQGNPTSLWIGKTFTERLIEVGVEYLEDCNHIYHAAKARSRYAAQYANKAFRQV